MTHRTLILLRHGKSAYPAGVSDHDRPLAHRGRREAGEAGEWIRGHVDAVDLVLCSTATRTRQTLAETGIDAPVEFLDELYASSHFDYLSAIHEHGGEARTVLIVGHEPSVSATALELASDRTTHPARQIERKYPTSGIAVLRTTQEWAALETGHSELTAFHAPH